MIGEISRVRVLYSFETCYNVSIRSSASTIQTVLFRIEQKLNFFSRLLGWRFLHSSSALMRNRNWIGRRVCLYQRISFERPTDELPLT